MYGLEILIVREINNQVNLWFYFSQNEIKNMCKVQNDFVFLVSMNILYILYTPRNTLKKSRSAITHK